jgi:hypothetical protein
MGGKKMEQMMERLAAAMQRMDTKIDANQERMEAKIESEIKTTEEKMDNRQEDMKAQVGSLASWIDANQEEMKTTVSTNLQKMKSWLEEMKAYLEKQEANPEGTKSTMEHEEVPKEESAVKTARALKKRYGDQHIAVGHHRQLKKWSQADGGSQKKLAAAHRQMTRHAIPTRDTIIRDHAQTVLYKEPLKTNVWEETSGATRIRYRDLQKQLFLRKKSTSGRIFGKTAELEVMKQIVGTSIRLWKMRDWTLWRGLPPPKRKKRLQTE